MITGTVRRFVRYGLEVNADQCHRILMQLVWWIVMFSVLVSQVKICRKPRLNCFRSVLRYFEVTTQESLIPLDVKKEIPILSFVLCRTSPFRLFAQHRCFQHEALLAMALKIPNSKKMLHLHVFRDTSESSTLATLRSFGWQSFTCCPDAEPHT